MGLDNSLASGHVPQPLCRLTFFAHYWIDNRTGLDLMFHDHQSAPKAPVLLGARIPFDTTSVRVNGEGPAMASLLEPAVTSLFFLSAVPVLAVSTGVHMHSLQDISR